jgi:uncharacterized protein (DUF58 family)
MLETRAFEPDFLARLDGLILSTRRARAVRAGRRLLGRVQGSGIEPEGFREYAVGDDLRFLDWNAYARLDNLTVRTFRAERQLEMTILIDASASMGLPRNDDKLGLGLLLGASLAYIGMNENDPVRIGVFATRNGSPDLVLTPFRRRRETYPEFRSFLSGIKCAGQTQMAAGVHQLLRERRTPGIVIVISDFLVSAADYEDALGQLSTARHEVKVVHVMGDHERDGDYPAGSYRLRDSETGVTRDVSFGPAVADLCRQRAARHAEQVASFCTRRGIAYMPAFGATHLEEIVTREFPRFGVMA